MKNIIKAFKKHLNEPLFKNSYFLMGNTVVYAGIGFIFWLIAAKLYSASDIGYGSAILNTINLIALFSLFGFDISLIRFLPNEKDTKGMINSCYAFSTLITLILSLVFLLGIQIWSPQLYFLKTNIFLSISFIIFTIFNVLATIQISIFVAFRKVKYSFFQSLSNIFRIIILPLMTKFQTVGIYSSFGVVYIIMFFFGELFMANIHMHGTNDLKGKYIWKMFNYSFKNYIANILYSIPTLLLPLIVLNIMGPVMNAYFYIPWMFSSILLTAPNAISRSLLAEGSFEIENFIEKIKKSLKLVFLLLIPINVLIIMLGQYILHIFGSSYANNSYGLLLMLCLTSIPYSINQIYISIKRVQNDLNPIILNYGFISIVTIVGSYLIINIVGLIGIGIVWFFANTIIATTILFKIKLSKK